MRIRLKLGDFSITGSTTGSENSVGPNPHNGGDTSIWNVAQASGTPTAQDGQALFIKVKGCAIEDKSAPSQFSQGIDVNRILFQALAPQTDGSYSPTATAGPFQLPFCSNSATRRRAPRAPAPSRPSSRCTCASPRGPVRRHRPGARLLDAVIRQCRQQLPDHKHGQPAGLRQGAWKRVDDAGAGGDGRRCLRAVSGRQGHRAVGLQQADLRRLVQSDGGERQLSRLRLWRLGRLGRQARLIRRADAEPAAAQPLRVSPRPGGPRSPTSTRLRAPPPSRSWPVAPVRAAVASAWQGGRSRDLPGPAHGWWCASGSRTRISRASTACA